MNEQIKAWPNWQDGAPMVPGWCAVVTDGGQLTIVWVNRTGTMWTASSSTPLYPPSIARHCPMPDFAAIAAERDAIRAEVARLAAAVNEANERADRAERNAADPLPWGGR